MRLSGSRRYQKGAQGASAPTSLPRLVAASSALFLDANVLGPHLGLNSAFLFEPFGLLFEECGDLIRGECFFDAAAGQAAAVRNRVKSRQMSFFMVSLLKV